MIYTIGYQALTPDKLKAICTHLDAGLIDCRASPRSRVKGFGGRQLEALFGPWYVSLGHCLGGRGQTTPDGIESIAYFEGESAAAKTGPRNCMLMCMETAPWECHRHHDIVQPHFPKALHVYMNGLYSPADVERMIETRQPVPVRGTVFPE